MNSTSCILLITLLVIVLVGVCMSHPAGKAGMVAGPQPFGPNGPPDGKIPEYPTVYPVGGKITNLLTGGQHRTGGKAGMAAGPQPFGPNGPPDGKIPEYPTVYPVGGKAGFTPKPKSNCQTDQDCPGYDGSSETMCISNSFVNGVNVCTPKCVGTDPESCGFKGRCEEVMPFADGKFTYYYCNAKDKKHPCTESCYNANPL